MKKVEFESVKIRRATDIIENRISRLILNGTIKPGEKLPTEKELSDQFDVSVVTVRQALRGLEVTGMIEKKRGKGGGIYITEIDNESVIKAIRNFLKSREYSASHLAQVRLMIEPTIVSIVAQQITPDELENLEKNINYCERKFEKGSTTIRLRDYHAIAGRMIEFHELIAQATHNPVLVLTMEYVLNFLSDFKKPFLTPDDDYCTRVVKDHRYIFTSLKEGNIKEAEAKMLSHLKYLEVYQMDERL